MSVTKSLVEAAGGSLAGVVEAALALTSALWKTHANNRAWTHKPSSQPQMLPLDRECVRQALQVEILDSPLARRPGVNPARLGFILLDAVFNFEANRLTGKGLLPGIHPNWFSGIHVLSYFGPGGVRPADLKYALMRYIRQNTGVILSATAARAAYRLGDEARRIAGENGDSRVDRDKHLAGPLNAVSFDLNLSGTDYVQLALEVWSAIGAIRPATTEPGYIEFRYDLLDGGHLLAMAFGLPTSIPGFDELFSGGLILPDVTNVASSSKDVAAGRIGARTVVVTAPFGSGKSLLSLQVAVEVARKGGVAWILELEQSAHECLYALESMGVGVQEDAFAVVSGYAEAFPVLSRPNPGRGALVFLPVDQNLPISKTRFKVDHPAGADRHLTAFQELVQNLPEKLSWLEAFPLRLLVIDPLSAMYPVGSVDDRSKTVQLLKAAKRQGVNIWITSEQTAAQELETHFEENIADTVVRLGINRDSSERYIEVTKSRLQRETTGQHVFHITSQGLRIHPTPSGYLRRHRTRHPVRPSQERKELKALGVASLREVLGRNAIYDGDIIALHGVTGTSKTIIGLQFLRAIERPPNPMLRSLFIGDLAESRMQHLISQAFAQETTGDQRRKEDILTLPVPPGLIDGGEVLTLIRHKIEDLEAKNCRVDRVMVANLSRWQLDMPRIGADQNFSLALIGILRHYGVTAVLVCGHSAEQPGSPLENLLLEMADCSLELRRAEFRGQDRYYLQVVKSRMMQHRHGRFEVTITTSRVAVSVKESLIRLDNSGKAQPVEVVLFLHSETKKHALYNERLVGALRSTLSPHISLAPQTRSYDPQVLRLSSASGLDEVQILQLDQFQLPRAAKGEGVPSSLHAFPYTLAGPLLSDRIRRLQNSCVAFQDSERFVFAIPFYSNISLLAWQKRLGRLPPDWSTMANACEKHQGDDLFFACHVMQANHFESYNCLFLEILYSKLKPQSSQTCSLAAWLQADPTITEEALRCFHILVRPWHRRISDLVISLPDDDWQRTQNELISKALISRHWYNTLNQMMTSLNSEGRAEYDIAWLPCERPDEPRMTTAGEWYLTVPQYSAAPEVALDVIEFLTAPDKEMQRVHIGVGLPTRADYYRQHSPDVPYDVSPHFTLDMNVLDELILRAFQRSQFSCYQAFAETMSSHLQRLLNTAAPSYKSTLDGLLEGIQFFQSRQMCETCPMQ